MNRITTGSNRPKKSRAGLIWLVCGSLLFAGIVAVVLWPNGLDNNESDMVDAERVATSEWLEWGRQGLPVPIFGDQRIAGARPPSWLYDYVARA